MGLLVNEIPVPDQFKHPPPPDDVLPNHEFTMALIAPKGSGKTTLLCNLLLFYKNFYHTIYVFSPTVASDEKWDFIKSKKLLVENKPLKKWIKEYKARKQRNKNPVVQDRPNGEDIFDAPPYEEFDGYIPEENFKTECTPEDIQEIMDEQMALVRLLKKNGQSKHLANRILIIFDDLVGSDIFKNHCMEFKKFNTNHRHYSVSMLMVTQAYKEIPKTVRTQFTCGIVFEIPNERELLMIYEENPLSLKKDDWLNVYEHCTGEDYSFMFFNYQKPKRLRIMKKFDKYMIVNIDDNIPERNLPKRRKLS